jgi:hypothetical protein
MQKQQTTAGGETLSFDYTFDIPVEVAAAVCKYRHDRWKFEWGKPQFTRLDVAMGSKTEVSGLARHVRFTLRSRHRQPATACPFGARSGHFARSLK